MTELRHTFTRHGYRVVIQHDRDHIARVLEVRRAQAAMGLRLPDAPVVRM